MRKRKIVLLLLVVMLYITCLPVMAAREGWQEVLGTWYYYNASGSMAKDTWIVDKIGTTPNLIAYYVDAEGKWVEDAVYLGCEGEWIIDQSGWWFQRKDGTYPKNEFEYINGKWYFFNEDGYMKTGFLNNLETGNISYFYPDGSMAEDAGWIALADGSYIYIRGHYCVVGEKTPDGYQMDKDGKWHGPQ